MLKFGKHKDWSTQQVYLIQELVQLIPVSQSLQAPLHLMAGPGQSMSISSLAALMQVTVAEMSAEAAARDALGKSASIGTDAALATSLIKLVTSLLSGYSGSAVATLQSVQQNLLGCQTIANQLLMQTQTLTQATQQADVFLQGVVERVSTHSKMLSSTPMLESSQDPAPASALADDRASLHSVSQSLPRQSPGGASAAPPLFGLNQLGGTFAGASMSMGGQLPQSLFQIPLPRNDLGPKLSVEYCGETCGGEFS